MGSIDDFAKRDSLLPRRQSPEDLRMGYSRRVAPPQPTQLPLAGAEARQARGAETKRYREEPQRGERAA